MLPILRPGRRSQTPLPASQEDQRMEQQLLEIESRMRHMATTVPERASALPPDVNSLTHETRQKRKELNREEQEEIIRRYRKNRLFELNEADYQAACDIATKHNLKQPSRP